VFDADGNLVRCGQNVMVIEQFGRDRDLNDFGFVSFNPLTGDAQRY
jgi:hypothetical protein